MFFGSKTFIEKAQAVRFYAEKEEQEKAWRAGLSTGAQSLQTVLQDYHRHARRYTQRTQQHYETVLHYFVAGLPKNVIRVQQIEPHHIQEYLYRLRDRKNKNRTANAHLTAIKSFCRWYAERYSLANPAAVVKPLPEDPPEARFLTRQEYAKLLKVAEMPAKERIIFLANTGLRASEFASLTPDSISPQATAITVRGKGRKRRTIPLNKSARSVLPTLKIATPNAMWLQLNRLSAKAGLEKFGPHSLRHYFATELLRKGVPLIVVSRLLGHASTRTTEQIYAHILRDDLKDATDVLDI